MSHGFDEGMTRMKTKKIPKIEGYSSFGVYVVANTVLLAVHITVFSNIIYVTTGQNYGSPES